MPRTNPLCNVPKIIYGNKIVDGGNYLFDDDELNEFLKLEPNAKKYIKPILSGKEYLEGHNRYCLWLKDITPYELKNMPYLMERVQKVKEFRLKSSKIPTRETAKTPTLFAEIRQPDNDFIIIPRTTSENRKYIPFAYFSKDYIVNDSCIALPKATIYHFGIISSEMHMVWTKYTCGKLEGRLRYSNTIVYNNYPWPENPTAKNIEQVEEKAQNVLDVRKEFPDSSLADLYDPISMPLKLVKAHQELDKAVDLCYSNYAFTTELSRLGFLFFLYKKYTSPLLESGKKRRKKN